MSRPDNFACRDIASVGPRRLQWAVISRCSGDEKVLCSDVAGEETVFDIFRNHVVGFDELPYLRLERVILLLLARHGDPDNQTEPLGELSRLREYEHVTIACRDCPAVLYLVYLVGGPNAPYRRLLIHFYSAPHYGSVVHPAMLCFLEIA